MTLIKSWRTLPPGKEKYQVYLASREWAILKEAVRRRSGGICERCRAATASQVHHQTYQRIYAELLDDLIHLCAPCHEFLSGKRDEDPLHSVPVFLFDRLISGVYLAGKITGQTWRDEIVTCGWSCANDSAIDFDLYAIAWQTVEGCLPLPDGRSLDLTGPYYVDFYGGHGNVQSNEGPHALGSDLGHGHVVGTNPDDLIACRDEIIWAIRRSDLLFAWVDSWDCYGTLVEIGIARALGKIVVIAAPPALIPDRELWLAFVMGWNCEPIWADSPGLAWDAFWRSALGEASNPSPHETQRREESP